MKKEGSEIPGQADRARLDTGRSGKQGISLRNLRTFSSLENPAFRLYFCGMVGMTAPVLMQMIVRSLLIYRLTGSAAILGLVSLASAIPGLVLGLFGGVIADQIQKKHVLFAGLIASALVDLGIALSLTLGYLSAERPGSWWILALFAFFQGIVSGLVNPSRQAIIREIISEERLLNAVSLDALMVSALRLLTPALAGFLIDAFDFDAVYYTMTGIYLLGAVFIIFLPRTSRIADTGHNALADIMEGFRYIRHQTAILFVLVLVLFSVILSTPYQQLLPIFTEDILKVGATGMGVMMSVSGIGAVIGSLILASLPNRKRGALLLATGLLLGVALVGFSFSASWNLSLVLIAFAGLGQAGRTALSHALLQHYSTDEYRGRVMSFYMMELSLSSLGTFGAALLVGAIGVQWAVGGFAIVLVSLSILALIFVPRLRKLE